jgi:Cu-Zn family superoxide dismutase
MNRRPSLAIFVVTCALSLVACGREAEEPVDDAIGKVAGNEASSPAQNSNLGGANGAALGKVSVSEDAGGLTIAVNARGIPGGMHGIHLHERGVCDVPAFQSAGGHWNPGMKKHGRENPQGSHMGDLANLEVGTDGTAKASFQLAGAKMASGATMLADVDGTALVIHAKPDDYKTDPSGASGDRIACAVIAAPR